MYTEYFGFRQDPFADAADLDFFYSNPTYHKAHATLLAGIREYKGFLLLTGETGTGKTTLLRRLMKDVESSGRSVLLDSTSLASATIDDLLYVVCAELGLHRDENGRVATLRMFNSYLNTLVAKGKTGVLLVDEAHHLTDDVLGGLRLIAPPDLKSERVLLQVVLVGQPELEYRLAQPTLRPILQRVALRCRLDCLHGEEVSTYILHRLRTAGGARPDLFSPEALQRISHFSKGIPRLINIICDNALLLAYREGRETVSAQCIESTVATLRLHALAHGRDSFASDFFPVEEGLSLDSLEGRFPPPRRQRSRAGALLMGGLLALGVGLFAHRLYAPLVSLLPSAAPVITQVTPALSTGQSLALAEGQALTFAIAVSSTRPETLSYVWFVDGKEISSDISWTYRPQFDEGGQTKTVSVRVTDAQQKSVEQRWNVYVQDVNRSPRIVSATPQGGVVEVQKGTIQSFAVVMEDPDADQHVDAVWFFDEKQVAQGSTWTFAPLATTDEGYHSVKVMGKDSGGIQVEQRWIVTVVSKAPVPIRIVHSRPEAQRVEVEEGQLLAFSVEVSNPQPAVRYTWLLDGKEQANGQRWTYQPRFTDGGQEKKVTVQVGHPTLPSEERSWQVVIQDVNRPPIITTSEPRKQLVKLQRGAPQQFSVAMSDPDAGDRLSAIWTVDGKEVAQGTVWSFIPSPSETNARYAVGVTVTDQGGQKVEKQWQVTVADVALVPLQISNAQPVSSSLNLTVGQPLAFSVEVPREHRGVEYTWFLNGQEQSQRRSWTYAPQKEDSGTEKTVTVRVRDRDNESAERSWQLYIQAALPPPPARTPVPVPTPAPLPTLLQEAEVRTWIEAQRRALEERDVKTLVELGALNGEQAERARQILSQYKNFRVTFQDVSIRVEGDRAEVSFSRIDTIEGTEVPHTDRKRFVLQKGTSGRLRVQPQ